MTSETKTLSEMLGGATPGVLVQEVKLKRTLSFGKKGETIHRVSMEKNAAYPYLRVAYRKTINSIYIYIYIGTTNEFISNKQVRPPASIGFGIPVINNGRSTGIYLHLTRDIRTERWTFVVCILEYTE